MTRLNLVPVDELTDQHLFAEFREIKMVPQSLKRSINARGVQEVLNKIPDKFTLNKNHVTFFYNKGLYLVKRYDSLKAELRKRGYNVNFDAPLDREFVYINAGKEFINDYKPTLEALAIVRERIAARISLKPHWYRKTTGATT